MKKNNAIVYRNSEGRLQISRIQVGLIIDTLLEQAEDRREVEFLLSHIKEACILSGQDRLKELDDEYYYYVRF